MKLDHFNTPTPAPTPFQTSEDRTISISTVVIAVCAVFNLIILGVYVYYARKQWFSIDKQAKKAGEQVTAMKGQLEVLKEHGVLMQKNVDGAEQTLIYSQRAYVTAAIESIIHSYEASQFKLCVENGGNTPANNVVVYWNLKIQMEIPEECKVQSVGEGVAYDVGVCRPIGLIAPKKQSFFVIPFASTKDTTDKTNWNAGVVKLYCWGRIYYYDIFPERRRSSFAFVQSVNDVKGSQCEAGNDAY